MATAWELYKKQNSAPASAADAWASYKASSSYKQDKASVAPTAQPAPAVPQTSVEDRLAAVESELKRITNMSGTFDVSPYTQEELDAAEVRRQELEKERTQLLAEKAQTDPSLDQRIGKGAQSIGTTIAAAPRVLWDTTKQYFQNAREESQNEDRQRISTELENTLSQMHYMENYYRNFGFSSKTEAQASEKWQELNAKYQQLSQQLKGTEVNTPVSMDTKGMQMMQEASQQREEALVGLGKTGRFVGNALISVGQNVAMLPLAAITPALPAVAMGVTAAGSRTAELSNQGVGAGSALARGIVSGTIESLTEKLPIDTVLDLIKTGGKGIVVNLLKQAGIEATEEGVSYALNFLADKAAKDPNATFTLSELGYAMASGGFSGLLMGGSATGINRVQSLPVASRKAQAPVSLPVATQDTQTQATAPAASQGQNNTASTGETESTAYMSSGKKQGTTLDQELNMQRNNSAPSPQLTSETQLDMLGSPTRILTPTPSSVNTKSSHVEPTDSVGAAPAGFDPYTDALGKYGAIAPGETPARVIDVPVSTTGSNRVSQTARTAMEAQATPENMLGDVADAVMDGRLAYSPTTNDAATTSATETIRHKGFEEALLDWTADVRRGKVSDELTAMGALLYNEAANSGDSKRAISILVDYAHMVRSGARATQAARILKTLTPGGKLYYTQQSVERITDELNERYGKGKFNLYIPESLAREYVSATTDEARDLVMDQIYQAVADQVPSTFLDKFNALRYMAMLGNLRTQVRNFAGNALNMGVRAIDKKFQALFEALTYGDDTSKRTTSLTRDKALYDLAKQDFDIHKAEAMGEAKYSDYSGVGIQKAINDRRTIFRTNGDWGLNPSKKPAYVARKAADLGNRFLEAGRTGLSDLMEFGDRIFSKTAYADALARYLQAKGYTAEQWQNGQIPDKVMEAAVEHAVKEAQEATFRESSAFSQMISDIGFKRADTLPKRIANTAIKGAVPFRKTPANVAVQAEQHSPIGLINTAINAARTANPDSKITGNDVIKSLSKSLTGTGLFALGMILFRWGVAGIRATGGENEDETISALDSLQGKQEYSLVLPNGTYYSYESLTPASIPFAMGVEFGKAFEDGGNTLDNLWQGFSAIDDVMLNMSMLQGINDVFENVSNSDSPAIRAAVGALADYVLQAITPSMFGQIERTFEDERMTTFLEPESALPTDWQYELGSASQKVPGWDFQQIPYIDAWGRTQDSGSVATRAFENFLSPGYISSDTSTDADKEIRRLAELGQTGVVPMPVKQSYQVTYTEGGESKSRYMSADEYVQYATTKGQTSLDIVTDMIDSDVYATLTDAQKAEAIKVAYSYAAHVAAEEVTDGKHESDKFVELAQAAQRELGLSEAEYLLLRGVYQESLAGIAADKDWRGNPVSGSKKEKVVAAIDALDISDSEKDALYLIAGYAENELWKAPWN